jgi:MATE family multidrug resistance protein
MTSPAAGGPDRHPFVARPHRTLVALSIPVMLSMIAEPLTGLVDTAFVARLGAEPAAALGVATVLLSSLLWVFNFLGIGTQTEVAQALGARDRDTARETAGLALAVSAVVGVALGIALWPLLGALCAAMGAGGEVRAGAVVYLEIRLLGAPPLLVTVAAFGALRGLHDMKTPLWIAAGTNAANALLCAVLVAGAGPIPGYGIAGAAWATVVAQWAGAVFALAAIRTQLGLPARIEWRRAGALLVVGRDLFLRTGLLVLFVALTTRAATRLGADSGAAHQAIRQVWILTAFALDAFGASAQSLVGWFVGAGRPALARRVALVAVEWGTGVGAAIAAGMLVSGDAVAALLVPAEARAAFATAWWIAALAQPLSAVSFVTDGIHWGTRDYRYLRNAMALASAGGALLLVASDASSRATLASVWWITALWIAVRAAAGAARVWPGIGRAPLGPAAAGARVVG